MKQQSTFGPLVRSRWLLLWVTACSAVEKKVTFGPDDCVSLSRSAGGTCVLATNCEGKDTSAVEFSFLCADATGMEVKHTFGTGGFLDKETYDTEVACEKCLRDGTEAESSKEGSEEKKAPAKAAAPAEASAPAEADDVEKVVSTADSRALLTKFAKSKEEEPAGVPPATASFYGPGGCVAVYTKDGSCWMQTRCAGQNISDYDFGMNCADSDGQITKHMFGKNSFDPEETFNTLVTCEHCLALDQEPAKGVSDLAITVLSLEKELDAIKTDVKSIKDEVMPKAAESTEKTTEDAGENTEDAGENTEDAGENTESAGENTEDAGENTEDAGENTEDAGENTETAMVAAEREAESAESREAADAAASAAEAAATEDAEDDDDAKMFLKKAHKSMKKVRHHAPQHHAAKKVHHRAHAAIKKHVHHKRVVDADLDLDQPDMAEY